jgi:hypothetical protein
VAQLPVILSLSWRPLGGIQISLASADEAIVARRPIAIITENNGMTILFVLILSFLLSQIDVI